MMQREAGPVPPEFSLWRSVESNGRQYFRHVITRTESSSPPMETGGGILADEMGMGKSLSILSLLARTLGSARDWVDELDLPPLCDRILKLQRSRAILVVVSSGCEYPASGTTVSIVEIANSDASAIEQLAFRD